MPINLKTIHVLLTRKIHAVVEYWLFVNDLPDFNSPTVFGFFCECKDFAWPDPNFDSVPFAFATSDFPRTDPASYNTTSSCS
jgi:hypothetical protein